MEIILQQATEHDLAFLLDLRHQVMDEYLVAAGLPVDDNTHLGRIRYQFDCARIVYVDQQRAGLFKSSCEGAMWHVFQIQILPAYQGKGVGTRLLTQLLSRAKQQDKIVSLNVLKTNPAIGLYHRLGFVETSESEREYILHCPPAGGVVE